MSHTAQDRAACISVDLDALRCYTAIHGLPHPDPAQPDPILTLALTRMLEQFEASQVRATFFCVGQDLADPTIAELLRQATVAGHELANHSFSHHYNLRSLPLQEITQEIARAEDSIRAITGSTPVGFRTPGYNLSPALAEILKARGYLYDSSLLPSPVYYSAKGLVMLSRTLKGQPSRSQMTLLSTLRSPLRPYVANIERPWRRLAEAPDHPKALLEIPMCVLPGLGVPVIGTSLHLLGSAGFSAAMPVLRRTYPTLFNLEFHAIDWIDAQDHPALVDLASFQPDLRKEVSEKMNLYQHVFQKLKDSYENLWTLQQALPLLQAS